MAKRQMCVGCSNPFPLSELHIDPQTSEWYCDPCYSMTMNSRIEPEFQSDEEDDD